MTLPPPSATGVRTGGDRFQWLVAWLACVTVLYDAATSAPNPVLTVGVEVDGVGNLDDVVLYRQRPPHTYQQVKYAVNHSTPISTAYLTQPSSANGTPILRKIADAWHDLTKAGDPAELAIVTNRAPDPADPLVSARDARTRRLLHAQPPEAHGRTSAKRALHGHKRPDSPKLSCWTCSRSSTSILPATVATSRKQHG